MSSTAAARVDAVVASVIAAPEVARDVPTSLLRAVDPDRDSEYAQWADVLSHDQVEQSLRLLAAATARIVARGGECIPNSDRQALLRRLGSLDFLAKPMRLEGLSMSFELEERIRAGVEAAEADFGLLVVDGLHLGAVAQHRANLMRQLRSGTSPALIKPFLPANLLSTRLDEVFKLTEEYRQADGPEKAERYRIANEAGVAYVGAARKFGTIYSNEYLAGAVQLVVDSLAWDFEQSAFSKPARLTVLEPRKKFPLSRVGDLLEVVLVIANEGQGEARDVQITLEEAEGIALDLSPTFVGRVGLESVAVTLPATVSGTSGAAVVQGCISWVNHDGTLSEEKFIVGLEGQSGDIPWGQLQIEDPYSLGPVERSGDLVGRAEVLSKMVAEAGSRTVGSMLVFGQKRVGKTSVVKTLESELLRRFPDDYAVVYLEGGDYVQPDADATLRSLGVRLCNGLKRKRPELADIPTPEFTDSLTALSEFVEQVAETAPSLRCLFILDEFDELPIALYKRGPVGDGFFLTVRTVAGKSGFGFCLVGGERMELILSAQGKALNRFQSVPLDYFDKAAHWRDFSDLVRRPVAPHLEYSDDAIDNLYEISAGNPFFTKQVCRSLLSVMIERRDAYITSREIEEARVATLRNIQQNAFQHFWEDGVLETGEGLEAISIDRRKVLLAWADSVRRGNVASESMICDAAQNQGLSPESTRTYLRDFVRRKVLEDVGGAYRCVVRLFGDWLVERGPTSILTDFMDPAAVARLRAGDEAEYVKSEEIVALVQRWGTYRGVRVTEDAVRDWLGQFGSIHERRLMFQLVQGLLFVDRFNARELLREGNAIARRGVTFSVEKGQRRVREIAVGYIDGAGKSGAAYASLFAEENNILAERVLEKGSLARALSKLDEVQALVFVDDFIGTGTQAIQYFEELKPTLEQVLANKPSLKAYFLAIAGFGRAQDRVRDQLADWRLPIDVRILKPMTEADRLFSDSSLAFPDPASRVEAETIARAYGSRVVQSHPLGYNGLAARIVFESSIPNNDPPILWSNSKGWRPLFERM